MHCEIPGYQCKYISYIQMTIKYYHSDYIYWYMIYIVYGVQQYKIKYAQTNHSASIKIEIIKTNNKIF